MRAKDIFLAGLKLLDTATQNIAEAGGLFAKINERQWLELLEEAPPPMRRTLCYVRAVGEGTMIPQLATASGLAIQKLRSLPLADQRRLWDEPVELFAPGRVGRAAKYMRFATEMDSAEIKRSFEKVGRNEWTLRSYDEQRLYEAEMAKIQTAAAPAGVDRPGKWAVRNGKVYLATTFVDKGLTRRQLEAILRDMLEELPNG